MMGETSMTMLRYLLSIINPTFPLSAGSGCPSSWASFNGTTGNDDGIQNPACGRSSEILAPNITTRIVYIIIGGYNGQSAPYNLTWDYWAPTPSNSIAPTPSPPRTLSPTMTKTVGVSRTGTPTFSGTGTRTGTRTRTPTATGSNLPTPSVTPTGSSSPGYCGAAGSGVDLDAQLYGTSGSFSGSTAGRVAVYPYGNCKSADETLVWGGGYQMLSQGAQMFLSEYEGHAVYNKLFLTKWG